MLEILDEHDEQKKRTEEIAADLLKTCRDVDAAHDQLRKTKERLADSERLLLECSEEYNEMSKQLEDLRSRLSDRIPECDIDVIEPFYT